MQDKIQTNNKYIPDFYAWTCVCKLTEMGLIVFEFFSPISLGLCLYSYLSRLIKSNLCT